MNSRYSPIHLGAPGDEISKKDLHAVTQRFKLFNHSRLQRIQAFLQGKQQDFLNLLPLLLHINHPLLPGFVSLDTPAGIPDYIPGSQTINTAKQFCKGFVYKRKALKNYPIHSIFLMGSVGSMAFLRDSDIDIWLCHQPDLPVEDVEALRQKTREIEKWAASLKIEAHFFLIDCEQFKRGENEPISVDSSGYTQHYLLLEEFYRTSIYIAGRVPVWWLVPPAQEKHYSDYVAHLLENRFLFENEIVDFGDLNKLPISEFVGATLWQIYKSLNSPHKSLLKLFLMESYASEIPEPQLLSLHLKQAIYAGDFSVDSLDPYRLVYAKVDGYLQSSQYMERLQLARECFYLKIVGTNTTALDYRTRQLRESFMQTIAQSWNWPLGMLENLGLQKYWTIENACLEHRIIREQLQNCLRIILKLAGNPLDVQARNHNDLKLINRKLRSSLDVVPGKVEVLTTRSMVHSALGFLCFAEHQTPTGVVWRLYGDPRVSQPDLETVYIQQADSLVELVCWAVVNGVYKRNIQLKLISASLKLGNAEFKQLITEISEFLARSPALKSDKLEFFEHANRLTGSLLVVNLGENLAIDVNSQQLLMSERSDPFSYGDNRECFVKSVLKISTSSWGEVTLQDYKGLEGFLTCMADVYNNSEQPLRGDRLSVSCFTQARARSIIWWIKALFDNLLSCFAGSTPGSRQRYILAGEHGYFLFRKLDNVLSYFMLENQQQLLQELGAGQPQFSQVTFDAFVLEQTFVPGLYRYNLPDVIQIFYYVSQQRVSIYVIDEKGALFTIQHANAQLGHLLKQYALFLNGLLMQGKLPAATAIQFYEIQRNSVGVVNCSPVQLKLEEQIMDLRVRIAYESASNALVIFCNEQKFTMLDGESYRTVNRYILNYRKNCEDYAVYISEIDVPCRMMALDAADQAQAVHYLRYKQKIEERLNFIAS